MSEPILFSEKPRFVPWFRQWFGPWSWSNPTKGAFTGCGGAFFVFSVLICQCATSSPFSPFFGYTTLKQFIIIFVVGSVTLVRVADRYLVPLNLNCFKSSPEHQKKDICEELNNRQHTKSQKQPSRSTYFCEKLITCIICNLFEYFIRLFSKIQNHRCYSDIIWKTKLAPHRNQVILAHFDILE